MTARLSHRVCAICRGPLTVHEEMRGGVCGARRCGKSAVEREVARRLQEVENTRRRLAMLHRNEVAKSMGLIDPESLPYAVVPSTSRPVVRLPIRRRREFLKHLAQVIREAVNEPESHGAAELPEHEQPGAHQFVPEQPITNAACSACRGFCCRLGGTHAFIDAVTIRRYLALRPRSRLKDVLRAYGAHLPKTSAQYSCVFHGDKGCTLPREMRAHICNTFHCADLLKLLNRPPAPNGNQVLIVAVHETESTRSRLFPLDPLTNASPRPIGSPSNTSTTTAARRPHRNEVRR